MKRTVIALLTLILLFVLMTFFPWNSDPPEADSSSQPTGHLNTNPTNPTNSDTDGTPKPPPDPRPNLIADLVGLPAEEAIRRLRERLTGKELASALKDLAIQYGSEGPEAAKEFILALPPGSMFRHALQAAVLALPPEELTGMIVWLARQWKADPGVRSALWGIGNCINKGVLHDVHGMVAFLADPDSVDFADSTRCNLISKALYSAYDTSPGEIIAIAESLQPAELRNQIMNRPAYIRARIQTIGADPMISEIVSQTDDELRDQGLFSLYKLTTTHDFKRDLGRAPVLTLLLGKEFPKKKEYLSNLVYSWIRADINAALVWVEESVEDAALRDAMIAESWKLIAGADPNAAEEWIMSMTPGRRKDSIVAAYDKFLAEQPRP